MPTITREWCEGCKWRVIHIDGKCEVCHPPEPTEKELEEVGQERLL